MNKSNKTSTTISIPRFLFRYLRDDANLLETIMTPYLWFASPDSLNDPFELTNVLDANTSDENIDWYINKYAGKYFPEQDLKIKETLQNTESKKKMAEVMLLMLSAFHKSYLERIGLCCLSFVNNSPLLWSHYSGGHTGVCLVIDTKRFVKDFSLIKVDYRKTLPKWNIIERSKQWGESWVYNKKYDQVVLGTKYQVWEYEQEYRLISPNRGKHELYPESTLGIILGARMSLDRRIEIKDKIKNLHSNFQVIDACLEVSNGQVIVHGFENSIDDMPLGSWRHLSDPKGQFRDLNGNLINEDESEITHERTLFRPWFYKCKITYAEPSYGTEDFEELDEKLDKEINDELMKKYFLKGKFLHSKHSDKVISINEYFQELFNFAYSKFDDEKRNMFKVNEEMVLSFSGEPQYYIECSKGKWDIIAMGFKVIFTQFIDYSILKTDD